MAQHIITFETFKVEYQANAEYRNPLINGENITCVGQSLLYPIMKENNTLLHKFLKEILIENILLKLQIPLQNHSF